MANMAREVRQVLMEGIVASDLVKLEERKGG
jgi:hypothetical protein